MSKETSPNQKWDRAKILWLFWFWKCIWKWFCNSKTKIRGTLLSFFYWPYFLRSLKTRLKTEQHSYGRSVKRTLLLFGCHHVETTLIPEERVETGAFSRVVLDWYGVISVLLWGSELCECAFLRVSQRRVCASLVCRHRHVTACVPRTVLFAGCKF